MAPEQFRWVCRILWGEPGGHLWGAGEAARFLGVTERNVNYWGAGTKDVPPGVARELGEELRRRLDDPHDETPGLVVIRDAQRLNRVGRGTAVG